MANPSPSAISAIRDRVASVSSWTRTDQQVLSDLLADTVPNPAPRPDVPKPFAARDCLNLLSPTAVAAIALIPAFDPTIRTLLNIVKKSQDDINNLNDWAGFLFKGGKLSQSEFDALAAPLPGTTAGVATGLFNQVLPDPDWPATVPQVQVIIGRPVDLADVTAARP